jgi:hypothetical protein
MRTENSHTLPSLKIRPPLPPLGVPNRIGLSIYTAYHATEPILTCLGIFGKFYMSRYAFSTIRETQLTRWRQATGDHDYESDSSCDHVRESIVKKTWDNLFHNNDHLILGIRRSVVDLSSLHPEPIHIIRLWQTYLDNVDPLLKVTHNSTLQARIIDAASRLTDIEPPLEALMFSIYCIAVLSLSDEDCQTIFNAPRKDLLMKNHLACQEALLNCGYMRTSDRDCLTALHLYLVGSI